MSETFERIKNFNVSVKELKDNVIFLRKLVPGRSKYSFGIHVAKLAGMPTVVLHRANKMLKRLEKSHTFEDIKEKIQKRCRKGHATKFFQSGRPIIGRN